MSSTVVRQAVILAGGLGSRLGEATRATPKPLLEVGGRPFLAWVIRELSRFGVTEVLLLAGHLSDALRDAMPALAAALPRAVRITCSVEPERAGTGGALHHARPLLHARFWLLNGDSICDANLAGMLAPFHAPCRGRILLRDIPDTDRYGVVRLEGVNVQAFEPRAAAPGPGLVNAGVYLLDRDAVLPILAPACSLEVDVLPKLAAAGGLDAVRTGGWFIDIGVPEDLARARETLARRLRRRALLLDRDGTINRDHGWVGSRDRFEWMPGAREAVACATNAGWHVFVVTNQSGIARGLYDEAALAALHDWMCDEMLTAGGTIDDIRFCPFHEAATVARYRRSSEWRKPGPGMVLDLIRAWELELDGCVLVGDQPTDVAAASAAGIAGCLFDGVDLLETVQALVG